MKKSTMFFKKVLTGISTAAILCSFAAINPITTNAAAYGTRERLVEIAESRLGTTYSTYGYTYDWCAAFAHKCVKDAGGTDYSTSASTTQTLVDYRNAGRYHARRTNSWSYSNRSCPTLSQDTYYTPQPGDIVLLETNSNYNDGPDHTALVVKVEGTGIAAKIYTVEGNTKGNSNSSLPYYKTSSVNRDWWQSSTYIWGYCSPSYSGSTSSTPSGGGSTTPATAKYYRVYNSSGKQLAAYNYNQTGYNYAVAYCKNNSSASYIKTDTGVLVYSK